MKMYRKKFIRVLVAGGVVVVIGLGFLWRMYGHGLLGSHTTSVQFSGVSNGSLSDYYHKQQELSGSIQNQVSTVTFFAAGDINLSRNIAAEIQKSKNPDLPFLPMAEILKSADFNFANLESPIAPTARTTVIGGNSVIFGAPALYTKGLADYNFKILNLANNHAFDQGPSGINYTRSFLDSLGIKHMGTGSNLDEAWQAAEITTNGITACFVGASYASSNDGGKTTNEYIARIQDISRLKSTITALKTRCDFIVATMHAGIEYTRTPVQAQTDFAHAAIDDGADIVIGAHPHWAQTIETYKGKYIFYSLGNFIFDQPWSLETQEGLGVKIQISKGQISNGAAPGAASLDDLQGGRQPAHINTIQLIPLNIKNGFPHAADSTQTKSILQKIGQSETIIK